jgi:hypothetical protein
MAKNHGFEVCRACLIPKTEARLISLFKISGESAEFFQEVTGIDVSN